ncbi:MAG: hypothetical protein KGJ06_02425 [Pseudomonadota bacterium]|nr:hypothetical protein [Pseudomonadota bacterium]
MFKLLLVHLLLLLCLPFIWHYFEYRMSAPPATPGVMTQGQSTYYDAIFSYAMEYSPDNSSYPWQEESASGTIIAGVRFISPSHAVCRPYTETYVINGVQGKIAGYGCRRAGGEEGGSWCQLQQGKILTCALESTDWIGSVLRSISHSF